MYYRDGVPHGPSFLFDSAGNYLISKYNYFGLSVGPTLEYQSGQLSNYYFMDFEYNIIVECSYDSTFQAHSLFYDNQPILTNIIDTKRDSALKVFYFLPRPPYIDIQYKIGLENNNKVRRNESIIVSSMPFIDTVLAYPEYGWHYFISAQIQTTGKKINKLYFHELRPDSIYSK